MKKIEILHHKTFKPGPMTEWVHRDPMLKLSDTQRGLEQVFTYEPLPKADLEGFSYYKIEVNGFTFEFASLKEIEVCIKMLSPKNLPNIHGMDEKGVIHVNSHWFNRLPGEVKSWKYRQGAVKYLNKFLDSQLGKGV